MFCWIGWILNWSSFFSLLRWRGFHQCTKDNLLFIANGHNVAISKQIKKHVVEAGFIHCLEG